MEEMIHSGIEIDIEQILNIYGEAQYNEILVSTKDKEYYKIAFDYVKDLRGLNKKAQQERLSKMQRNEKVKSSVVIIANSEYIDYFVNESYGMIKSTELTDYMIMDDTGFIVEVLQSDHYNPRYPNNPRYPKLIKVSLENE